MTFYFHHPTGLSLMARLVSSAAGDDGANVSGFRNDEYDLLYEAQAATDDTAARREAVQAAQALVYEQVPIRPIFYPVVGAAYRSDSWSGIEPAVGNPLFNVWNAVEAEPLTDRDTLIVGTTFEPPTLNPTLLDTLEAQLPLSLIYDPLMRIGRDGELMPWAAEEVTTDGRVLTVRIREGMTFHDGEPVTADDVAFSLQYVVDTQSPAYSSRLTAMESATALDEHTVEIVLHEPSAAFPAVALATVPVLPEHIWSSIDNPTDFVNEAAVGSGPFSLDARSIGSSVTFSANTDHFSSPVVSALQLVVLGSFDAGIGALGTGEIDLLDDVQNAVNFETLLDQEGVEVVQTESHGWRGLHFNMRHAPFDDLHFRTALSLLVPTQDIIDVIVAGYGAPAGSFIPPVLSQWHNEALDAYETDPAAAMAELDAAGYVRDEDGTLYYPPEGVDGRVLHNDG
ncbi:Oligopeptide ABC transporter, periplasmic oligopeptide-binding protein OppA [Euzebya pacifica]|uniref:Oligopeptide ABC transporter, periplasmic oligopeptide-binding protein OppA n=1 Tax=Euzebya pacifica TaxID=1608957 RepID=A0A346Y174_9ACTN|nr:ABC transporter substrate-binding protein [Euzebya pacifica]AXV08221.1 Oligopeptide ABC transporter, periplasmic oligopeptide-binding protein OppA [Euzebya pacifica]